MDRLHAVLHETATIPAFHEMIVPAFLHSKPGKPPVFLCGLVEHRPEFVESSPTKRCTELVPLWGKMPLRIAKLTSTPQITHKNAHVFLPYTYSYVNLPIRSREL